MRKKSVFLDIDGTISDYGMIQASTITAIQKARENGHKVFICTGRSRGMIGQDIIDIGFDGLVCSAGAYVEVNDKILFHQSMEKELLNSAIDYFQKYDIKYFLESNTKLYSTQESIEFMKDRFHRMEEQIKKRSGHEKHKKPDVIESMLSATQQLKNRNDINKISFTSEFRTVEQIKRDWTGKLAVIPGAVKEMGTDSGEISQMKITKATGVQHVIEHLRIPKESTMAVGDGSNDFEMLEYVEIGIAMGNALEELKKVADYVTESIDQDGIYSCFLKYGLLT